MKIRNTLYILCSVVMLASCNYLDVEPVGKVIPNKVTEYRALLTSGYSVFPKQKYLLALRSDEVMPFVGDSYYTDYIDFAVWKDNSPNTTISYPWGNPYKTIFYANSVIDGIMDAIEDTDEDSKEQIKGEALLLRAYTHFDLLNLYGKPYNTSSASSDRGIPIATDIDIEQTYVPATVEKVYAQILSDIEEGRKLLQVEEQEQNVRYRFSKKSAIALEARVRLYHQEWDKALELAEELLPTCALENLNTSSVDPSLNTSSEMIMSLEVVGNYYLNNGTMYVLPQLMNKYNLSGDKRVDLYFKKKDETHYICKRSYKDDSKVTFRSGEIYLIAAEAAAHIDGKLDIAKTHLKELMENRLTPAYYSVKSSDIDKMNQSQLIAEIADERARELAMEGHRWFDLRRTTRPRIEKTYVVNGVVETAVLEQNGAAYTVLFPKAALENNPDLRN